VRRCSARAATCHATNAPRLDPISTTGPGGAAAIAASTCPIIRDVVSVSKAGSFKSGASNVTPAAVSRSRRTCALPPDGDDTNPWR
jgi:hypothetical protein